MLRRALVASTTMAIVMVAASPSSAVVTADFSGDVFDDAANDSYAVRCSSGTLHASTSDSMRQCSQLFVITMISGPGTDFINLADVVPAAFSKLLAVSVFAAGNVNNVDTIVGSPFSDYVTGDSTDVVTTGPGDDSINGAKDARGEAGDDVFRSVVGFASGGEGDDRFVRIRPQFGVDGGLGTDTWDLELETVAGDEGTTVVLDQGALVVTVPGVQPQVTPAAPPAPPVVAPPVAAVPVTGAISGPKTVTKPAKGKCTFASTTAGATFQCKVDGKAWKACTSPYKVATKKLKPDKHKLRVRAVVGGVVDATPSKKVFRIRRG